jgi:hypothetical protein
LSIIGFKKGWRWRSQDRRDQPFHLFLPNDFRH